MTPVYVIAASVASGNRVREFYSARPGAPRYMLRDAGELRHGGFDLGIGEAAERGPDGCWQAVQGSRKTLRLYQDGTLIFRAVADDSFLGWAQKPEHFLLRPRLNPVGVVEVHASFVTFYAQILRILQEAPDEVLFKLVLRNHQLENEKRLFMTEHHPGDTWEWADRHEYAVEIEPPEAMLTLPARSVLDDPNAVAYQLLEQFFGFFEMPVALLPFVQETDGVRRVDVASIGRR